MGRSRQKKPDTKEDVADSLPPSDANASTVPPVDVSSREKDASTHQAARLAADAAKAAANRMFATATCRKDYGNAAAAYSEAIREALLAGLTPQEDGDILGVLWSNEAFALLRAGDYTKAKASCNASVECASTLPQNVREKVEVRLKMAKAGLKLLKGQMGRISYTPTVPDSWFTQDPDSDIVRMCWGWRSELEVAVRESKPTRVAKLVAGHDFMEVRCFIESRTLVEKAAALGSVECVRLLVEEGGGDVDGMREGCPSGWDICRRGGGYNGCTPLYGAAQGGPVAEKSYGTGSLEGRTQVAAYLLENGANPMTKSDPPAGLTPFFMACINNALPIVKLMIESGRADPAAAIPDGNTPLVAVRNCVSEGFKEYNPLLELLEKELTVSSSSAADQAGSQLAVALTMKEAGNEKFKAGDYHEALTCYRRSIETCKQVRGSAGADLAACDELQVTASSNAAAACLKVGLSYKAEAFCQGALALQPDHGKATARLATARLASSDHETNFLRPYQQLKDQVATLAADGRYHEGSLVANQAVALAAKVGDGLLEAKALLSLAEMCLANAVDAEDETLGDLAREAANNLLAHCHNWEKTPGLSNSRKDGSILNAQLRSCEAMAWLFMARLDISARDNVAEGHRKLTGEVLRLLALVEQKCPSNEMEMSVYLAEANARQLIVQARMLLNDCDGAVAAATELLDFVQEFQTAAFRCDHLCAFVVLAAECLADDRSQACSGACERLLRYAIEQAEHLGKVPTQAKWVRKLMNTTRSSDAYVRERDTPATARIAGELLGLLRTMGRRVDECAICLSPLDDTDVEKPIDVLECLHCFHVACVREHVHRNAQVSSTSDQFLTNDIPRPGGNLPSYCMNGTCPECRAPIQLLGLAA